MSHYDKLCKIDIPKARAQILKSIADYRKQHRLAELIEAFFTALEVKRIDARHMGKLKTHLIEQAPELKVHSIRLVKAKQFNDRAVYRVYVEMYDMDTDLSERSYQFLEKEDGTLDIDHAMVADRKWAAHADFLEQKLARFAYHATKFNDMVHALQNACEEAVMPGDPFPVYPLSKFYHWYQLHV